jgi:predicted transcriptional regulator
LAIEKVRKLPEADQDETAQMLFWAIEAQGRALPLDDETAFAIDEGLADARRGDFASEAEVTDL